MDYHRKAIKIYEKPVPELKKLLRMVHQLDTVLSQFSTNYLFL